MTRTDTHLDATLRHLGAAYYDSLHGRAAPADVSRALDRVAEQVGDGTGDTAHEPTRQAGGRPQRKPQHPPQHHGRWHSRVRDIMTTDVVTVDRITPYKTIAELLTQHEISGVPVLILGRHVAGVVSEADLIAAQSSQHPGGRRRGWRKLGRGSAAQQHHALTAEQLMTAPAITIHPDATIAAAARLMSEHHIMRLPVVDGDGKLLGLVSRRDLLSVFLRSDEDIARQVRELVGEMLPDAAAGIKVTVHGGVVTLIGQAGEDGQDDMLALAVRLTWDVDGVVDVVNKIGSPD